MDDANYDSIHARARQWKPGHLRAIVLTVIRLVVRVAFAPEITGRELVPRTGGVVVAANHRSLSDGLFQAAAFPRTLRWMGMDELFRKRRRAGLMLGLGAFPVRRGGGDTAALETARQLLVAGQAVAIYPEGKLQFRSEAPVGEPHSGAGRLALETGVDLLPMAMVGTDRLRAAALLRGRHRIRISFGEAVAADEQTRSGFLAGDRDAARRLIRERLWPRVKDQVEALRARPAAAAGGGGIMLVLIAIWLVRRRRS
jgi:1-acyl-sn-glycerol-3-phosphate acyltransferase